MSEQVIENCKWCYHALKIHVKFNHGSKQKIKQASFCNICKKKCRGKTFSK